ncbi:hypothetical protein M422DRAFT_240448 [Sphaerobolus stellatus SS14]|nr:hypothetical protein M422DRAFT_240448 [Sphaerobolus stellatus SS14]
MSSGAHKLYINDTMGFNAFRDQAQTPQSSNNAQAGPGPSTLASTEAAALDATEKILKEDVRMEDSAKEKETE